jgi:hypothetical protein
MVREAPRTIVSASPPYQQDIAADDIEVIVVENGSDKPLSQSYRQSLRRPFKILDMPSPRPSPVFAMNWAAREHATGDILMFAIDGARIFSDRLFTETLRAHASIDDAFVFTLAWHLGPKVQMISAGEGYDQKVEDRLIEQAGWPAKRDGLFDISVFAGSSAGGFFRPIAESNAFAIRRDLYERLGGYDERFTSPGAGLANLEMFHRYTTRPGARNVCLLGEGTFHQFHGGIATSGRVKGDAFAREYEQIFGRPYVPPQYETTYFGRARAAASKFLRQSLDGL